MRRACARDYHTTYHTEANQSLRSSFQTGPINAQRERAWNWGTTICFVCLVASKHTNTGDGPYDNTSKRLSGYHTKQKERPERRKTTSFAPLLHAFTHETIGSPQKQHKACFKTVRRKKRRRKMVVDIMTSQVQILFLYAHLIGGCVVTDCFCEFSPREKRIANLQQIRENTRHNTQRTTHP